MSASDSEYEEEEVIVFADFKNSLMLNVSEDPETAVKIIGIDSENPIAVVNGNVFKGEYDYSMGTHVFFEEDDEQPATTIDSIYEKQAKQNFKYLTKTNKVLNFSRIFVEREFVPTESTQRVEPSEAPVENRDLRVDITYEEALQRLATHDK